LRALSDASQGSQLLIDFGSFRFQPL